MLSHTLAPKCFDPEQLNSSPVLEMLLIVGDTAYFVIDVQTMKIISASKSIKSITGLDTDGLNGILKGNVSPIINHEQVKNTWQKIIIHLRKTSRQQRDKYRYSSCIHMMNSSNTPTWLAFNCMFFDMQQLVNQTMALFTITDVSSIKENDEVAFSISKLDESNKGFEIISWEIKNESMSIALNKTEYNILRQIIQGYKTPQIASNIHLSIDTIKSNRKELLKKFGVHKMKDVVKISLKFGI